MSATLKITHDWYVPATVAHAMEKADWFIGELVNRYAAVAKKAIAENKED